MKLKLSQLLCLLLFLNGCGGDSSQSTISEVSDQERFDQIALFSMEMSEDSDSLHLPFARNSNDSVHRESIDNIEKLIAHTESVRIAFVDYNMDPITDEDIEQMPIQDLIFFSFSQVTQSLDEMLRAQMKALQIKSREVETLSSIYYQLQGFKGESAKLSEVITDETNLNFVRDYNLDLNADEMLQELNDYNYYVRELEIDNDDAQIDDIESVRGFEMSSVALLDEIEDPVSTGVVEPAEGYTVDEYLIELGLLDPDILGSELTSEDIDSLKIKISMKMMNVNSMTQTEMMELQSITQKYNEAFEECSSLMKTSFDSISSIIRKL